MFAGRNSGLSSSSSTYEPFAGRGRRLESSDGGGHICLQVDVLEDIKEKVKQMQLEVPNHRYYEVLADDLDDLLIRVTCWLSIKCICNDKEAIDLFIKDVEKIEKAVSGFQKRRKIEDEYIPVVDSDTSIDID